MTKIKVLGAILVILSLLFTISSLADGDLSIPCSKCLYPAYHTERSTNYFCQTCKKQDYHVYVCNRNHETQKHAVVNFSHAISNTEYIPCPYCGIVYGQKTIYVCGFSTTTYFNHNCSK